MVKYEFNHEEVDHREANRYIIIHKEASLRFIKRPLYNELFRPHNNIYHNKSISLSYFDQKNILVKSQKILWTF